MMKRFMLGLVVLAALALGPLPARADPPPPADRSSFAEAFAPSLLASPMACAPGTQVSCSCPNGARGSQTCEATGARFSLCACASVSVSVPVPRVSVAVPDVPSFNVNVPRPRPRPHRRSSGQGMLIAGSIVTGVGVGSLIWGIERLKKTGNDVPGILLTVHGGVCTAVGLPLLIVGIAFVATRSAHPAEEALRKPGAPYLEPVADGLALHF